VCAGWVAGFYLTKGVETVETIGWSGEPCPTAVRATTDMNPWRTTLSTLHGVTMKIRMLVLTCLLLGSAVQAQDEGPEVTEDGLVRVPSSRNVGVYRLPEATFNQYQRVQIAPIKVAFERGIWDHHRLVFEKV